MKCFFWFVLKELLVNKIMCRDGRPHCKTLLGACEERGIYFYVKDIMI